MKIGEKLEQPRYKRDFDSLLLQCQKMVKHFDGSDETLAYIRRIEESLKNIISETN